MVVTTVTTMGTIAQTVVATMVATMRVITETITIHVAGATEGHQIMPRLGVRTNQIVVIGMRRAITTRVIVTGAHPDIGTQQRLQSGWAVQMHSTFQGMQNDDGRRN